MFERFTGDARRVVVLAQEVARGLNQHSLTPVHLLVAMATDTKGTAHDVLAELGMTAAGARGSVARLADWPLPPLDGDALATVGIDLDEVRRSTEAAFGPGALDQTPPRRDRPKGHIPFTKQAKKVMELSLRESLRLGDTYIGSGHVLLGILRADTDGVRRVLADAGIDPGRLRTETTRRLTDRAA